MVLLCTEVQLWMHKIVPLVSLSTPYVSSGGGASSAGPGSYRGQALSDLPWHPHFIPLLSHLSSWSRLPLSTPPSFPQESACPLSGPQSPSCQTILLYHCQPHQYSWDDARKEIHLFQPSPRHLSQPRPVPLGHPSALPCSMNITQCLFNAHSESGLLSLLMPVYRLCPRLPDNGLIFSLYLPDLLCRALTSGAPLSPTL